MIHDLQHHIVFDLPPLPEAHHFLDRCYRNMLFDRLGIVPSLAVPLDLGRIKDRLISELHSLSKRQLTAVIYFSANLGRGLLGIAVVNASINLGDLAQAYCSRLHCYLAGQSDVVPERYEYEPEVLDGRYCDDQCCVGSEYDHPVRLTSSCAVVQMLEKVRRCYGFPDE